MLGLHCSSQAFSSWAGTTLCCGARASHCTGFSCGTAQALGAWASLVAECELGSCGSRAPEHGLRSCEPRAQLLCDMWNLPRSGSEPMPPALAGRFLSTVSLGKSQASYFFVPLRWPNILGLYYIKFSVYHRKEEFSVSLYPVGLYPSQYRY